MTDNNKPVGCFVKREDGSDLFIGPFTVEVWNLAIEKAIEVCNKYESYGAAYEIRTLKL